MLKEGKTETCVCINKRIEKIVIDDEVKLILEIIHEIIRREKVYWLKNFYIKLLKGKKDIYILMDCPVERGKYYETKRKFYNKIYQCCICKGLVSYEEILEEDIG